MKSKVITIILVFLFFTILLSFVKQDEKVELHPLQEKLEKKKQPIIDKIDAFTEKVKNFREDKL